MPSVKTPPFYLTSSLPTIHPFTLIPTKVWRNSYMSFDIITANGHVDFRGYLRVASWMSLKISRVLHNTGAYRKFCVPPQYLVWWEYSCWLHNIKQMHFTYSLALIGSQRWWKKKRRLWKLFRKLMFDYTKKLTSNYILY